MLLGLYRNNNENTIKFPGKFKWAECSKENIQDAICHPFIAKILIIPFFLKVRILFEFGRLEFER
jgi:hypothetical protein